MKTKLIFLLVIMAFAVSAFGFDAFQPYPVEQYRGDTLFWISPDGADSGWIAMTNDTMYFGGDNPAKFDITITATSVAFDTVYGPVWVTDELGADSLRTYYTLITDTGGADSIEIYDNGTYAFFKADNPVKIQSGGDITLEPTGVVSIPDTLELSRGDPIIRYNGADTSQWRDNAAGDTTFFESDLDIALEPASTFTMLGNTNTTGEINQDYDAPAGASVGNIYKTTLQSGLTYTGGTTGYQFKLYDEDATVVHNGGEFAGCYINMKLQTAPVGGAVYVGVSIHNYASAIKYDAMIWGYGKYKYGFKASGDTLDYGIDLSETAIADADLRLHSGALIDDDADTLHISKTGGVVQVGDSSLIVEADGDVVASGEVSVGGALNLAANPAQWTDGSDTLKILPNGYNRLDFQVNGGEIPMSIYDDTTPYIALGTSIYALAGNGYYGVDGTAVDTFSILNDGTNTIWNSDNSILINNVVQIDTVASIGSWGYAGEHVVLPESSSNTNAGFGNYSMVNYTATAGKVFAATYSRMLIDSAQTNDASMFGVEAQVRLHSTDIANGSHAGIWAYAEQSGTSELSGGGTFNAISATVESEAGFTAGATENISCIVADGSINAGASGTISGSAEYAGLYIKSNGLDFYDGVKITGCDNAIEMQSGGTIDNSPADSMLLTETYVRVVGELSVSGGIVGTLTGSATDLDTTAMTDLIAYLGDNYQPLATLLTQLVACTDSATCAPDTLWLWKDGKHAELLFTTP